MKIFAKLFILCALICFSGCRSTSTNYEVGVDPSWYPVDFENNQNGISAFSTEILIQVGLEKHLSLSIIDTNWDVLLESLVKKKYQAILSSLYPYEFNQRLYEFSNLYLATGPILIVPLDSENKTLQDLSGKAIGVLSGSPEILLLEKDPTLSIRTYDSIPDTLNDLSLETIQGAVLPIFPASDYVRNLYFKELKIVSKPLNDQGLRMVTVKGQNRELIEKFDATLKKLKENGEYEKLLMKWNL